MTRLKPLEQWVCDTCGGLIEKPEDGWMEYYRNYSNNKCYGHYICHAGGGCYKDTQYGAGKRNLHLEGNHLDRVIALPWFGHILHVLELVAQGKIPDKINMPDLIEVMRRMYIPYYEEARFYLKQAQLNEGDWDGCDWSPDTFKQIIEEYEERNDP